MDAFSRVEALVKKFKDAGDLHEALEKAVIARDEMKPARNFDERKKLNDLEMTVRALEREIEESYLVPDTQTRVGEFLGGRSPVSPRTERIFTGRSQKEAARRPSPLRAARRIPRTPPTGSTGTIMTPRSNASSTPEYLMPGNYPSSGSSIPLPSSGSSRSRSIRSAASASPFSPIPFDLGTPTYSNAGDSPGPAVMSPMMTPGKVLEGEAEEEGLTVKEVRGIISKMKKEVRGPAYSRRLKAANKYQILREQFNAVQRGCSTVRDLDDVYSMMKTPDRARRYGGVRVPYTPPRGGAPTAVKILVL